MVRHTSKVLLLLVLSFSLFPPHAKGGFVNLIVNGDFEQGNVGFTSQYTYGQTGIIDEESGHQRLLDSY